MRGHFAALQACAEDTSLSLLSGAGAIRPGHLPVLWGDIKAQLAGIVLNADHTDGLAGGGLHADQLCAVG